MRLPYNAPVLAVDIDGTLADYYGHFHWFAELYLQRPVPVAWNREFRGEFSDALSLEKNLYRQIKLAYRQGGMKRSIPEIEGAGEVIRTIRKSGVQIWICTTRPWNRLDNIDPDTQFWLDNKIGRVDGLIYGENKYQDLIDSVGQERIIGVLDDLPENYTTAKALGLRAALISGEHNAWFRESNNLGAESVDNLYNFKTLFRSWKSAHTKENEE